MSQVGNAIKMYILLQARGKMKLSEIAKALEVDERQVRRYRDCLEQAGIYIEADRGKYGGYKLQNDNLMLGLNISKQEQYSLQLVEKYLTDSNHIAAKDISSLLAKINLISCKKEKEQIDFCNYMSKETISNINLDVERKKFLDIHAAVLSRNKIKMDYNSLNSGKYKRIVRPYHTLQYKQDLYVVGFCELKKEIRDFKISRIEDYEILDEKFPKDESFDPEKFMENCFGIYKGKEYNIKLKIMYPMSHIIKEKIWVKNQVITECEDNSIIFKAKMRGLEEIKTWILGMGSNVIVLEPSEIIEEVKNEIKEMKKLYMCNDMS
ncbi:helix-turn-helix transcriptional regulator [Acetivibrio clariflavus]|uniref:Putative transcriptional regulator n=1 Tax=Acetivibrio clariflavus (strain DSM 19732 / NBRC 101661 / EBR45) TaxID=720554 RepID=G8M0E0_ACECE|nr:transcriptional regulator [Acetivibrio clariflavus]AEV67985.1 putative transcriptional regulator [Acetivibrio clariflavus DSM 19732]